jgi:hypothetical protein
MKIIRVKYLNEYTLEVEFDDGTVKYPNFKDFILNSKQPMTQQFEDIERFKNVSINHGHLTWEDGQMDISAHSIYNDKF